MNSNRDYATENINLKQQIIDLKVANRDKAETIKSMKQELLEYSNLRDRFKVLYQKNEKIKKALEIIKGNPMCVIDVLRFNNYFTYREMYDGVVELSKGDFDLLKEVLGNES